MKGPISKTPSHAEQLDLDLNVEDVWHSAWGWNVNFERFLRREALKPDSPPVVWGLDEVDLLFGRPDSDDIFALFRSWHNARSLTPEAPWSRLTLAIAYATEAAELRCKLYRNYLGNHL